MSLKLREICLEFGALLSSKKKGSENNFHLQRKLADTLVQWPQKFDRSYLNFVASINSAYTRGNRASPALRELGGRRKRCWYRKIQNLLILQRPWTDNSRARAANVQRFRKFKELISRRIRSADKEGNLQTNSMKSPPLSHVSARIELLLDQLCRHSRNPSFSTAITSNYMATFRFIFKIISH